MIFNKNNTTITIGGWRVICINYTVPINYFHWISVIV